MWGRAIIDVNPRIKEEHRESRRYHQNIRIEGNVFRSFHPEIFHAHCVRGLVFHSNAIRFTGAYACDRELDPQIICEHCSFVDVSKNEVSIGK